jgi:hypothetical protein
MIFKNWGIWGDNPNLYMSIRKSYNTVFIIIPAYLFLRWNDAGSRDGEYLFEERVGHIW